MFGLSFLSPLYLLGALTIAVPIALHLFRRRTETVVDFPAVRLLVQSPVEQRRRRRLRELVLLALRVSALVLLAGAFARPYLAGSTLAADTPVTVVAVDTSFSLSNAQAFARARQRAEEAVQNAPRAHAVALVAFDESASTIVEPTTDRGAVVAAVGGLQAGASGTRYAAALAKAAELIGARPGRVVFITDLQQGGWDAAAHAGLADDIELEVVPVDGPLQNLAVVSTERREGRVVASLHNFGLEPRAVPVSLSVDGRVIERTSIDIPPQSAAHVAFDAPVPASGAASVAVEDVGGYAADDVRHLVLDPTAAARIAVVVADPSTLRGGLYVERALGAADEGREFAVTVVDGRALSAWDASEMAKHQALVVLGTRTLERRGRQLISGYLAGGGSMLLALGPDVDPGTLQDVLGMSPGAGPDAQPLEGGAATLVVGDARHPVFRPFTEPTAALGDVSFQRFRPIDENGRAVLARYAGGAAALLEQPRSEGRLLFFTSDLDNQWNRFPLTPAFVPFMVETARYLTAGSRARVSWVLPATPPGLQPTPGVFTIDTPAAGVEGQGRRVAVNVDTKESNPAPISREAFLEQVPRVPRSVAADPEGDARKAEDEQRLWQLGLLAMFLALAGEGLVGRRAN
ncbi:MAG: BatA domain-containing protein [Acidobacteria bacterium]|nr:BatA domain-containing protein [Acidobacteriota bacterium]